jgi:hypothetical protein
VQVGQLRYRVPNLIVDRSFGDVSAGDVRDRHVHHRGGAADGKKFVSIA